MEKLPDYLIEKYIIPFLSSDDLFYKFRSLGPYYYHCARCKILTQFPEEMMKTLKKIVEFNMKEDLTKTFEEVTRKTFSEKRVLLILMLQLNLSLQIKTILENTRDERALRLIAFFYVITKNEAKQDLMRQEKYDEIQQLSGQEESINEMNDKINQVCNEEDLDYDINEYNIVYNSLDEDFLRNNNYTCNLYSFVSLFLNFSVSKIKFNDIKVKLELFFSQINEASVIWPKKRNFYEKSIDLVADTQLLANGAKKMLALFKKYDIENDLTDFNYEKEAIKNYKSQEEYKIIKTNRKKLNLTILRIHQMYAFFIKCINYDKKDENYTLSNINFFQLKSFNVAGIILPVEHFLYILSMIKKKYAINETTFFITFNYLKHNIFHKVYNTNPLIEVDIDQMSDIINGVIPNKKDEEENKQIDGVKCISILNENIGDGINNFESIIESTKFAGEEINNSFKFLFENLEKFNNQLSERNNYINNNNNNS